MINKVKNNQKGFSFIEIIVSMSIFLFIIIFSSGIFSRVVAGQQKEIATQNTQETLRFALEIMSKELRMTKRFTMDSFSTNIGDVPYITSVGNSCQNRFSLTFPAPATSTRVFQPNADTDDNAFNDPVISSEIYFKNEYEECVHYKLDGEGIRIERFDQETVADLGAGLITPDNVKIKDLKFRIIDSPDYRHTPMVTIMIDAESGGGGNIDKMKLQTTIASRYYPY